MALDTNDMQQLREMMIDVVNDALNTVMLPRFDALENRMDSLEGRMDSLEGRMTTQERATRDLKDEMRSGFASVHKRIDEVSDDLSGKIEALESDVREIYLMLAKRETSKDPSFIKLSLEKKLLRINSELLLASKQAGIVLPRT